MVVFGAAAAPASDEGPSGKGSQGQGDKAEHARQAQCADQHVDDRQFFGGGPDDLDDERVLLEGHPATIIRES